MSGGENPNVAKLSVPGARFSYTQPATKLSHRRLGNELMAMGRRPLKVVGLMFFAIGVI